MKKKKPAPRQRQTLASAIRKASSHDKALLLANYGTASFTPTEAALEIYCLLAANRHLEKEIAECYRQYWQGAQPLPLTVNEARSMLCTDLINAIDKRDPEPFRQIARMLETKNLPLSATEHGDPLRAKILDFDDISKRIGWKMRLSNLARLLTATGRWSGKNDLGQLRRIAKELGISLLPERRGRRPIIRTRKASAKA